ncbi:MAG: thiamine pyrophosphate-dependent enzyme [Hyphomicrobiaceae bacterium]
MRAADAMVAQLTEVGIDRIFCVPGESYLSLIDACAGTGALDLVVCRHEGGAGFLALGDAKVTGRTGCVAVSRGPGATNVSIAIHAAEQDAVPLLVLIGQVSRIERGRGAFQEVDYAKTFSDMAKAVFEVHEASKLCETVARAVAIAEGGTPGPVVIAMPEDMLSDAVEIRRWPRFAAPAAHPSGSDIEAVAARLAKAERPLIIAGGGVASSTGRSALATAASTHQVPVALTFKRQELFDNASPLFAGHLGFKNPRAHVALLEAADLVIAVGTRLGDTSTQGYQIPRAPRPDQPLIHIHQDPRQIGHMFETAIGLVCDPTAFLGELARAQTTIPAARPAWINRIAEYVATQREFTPGTHVDGLDFGAFVAPLAKAAPKGTIVTMDAGNFSSWVHRLWPWDGTSIALGAVGGAMGLGIPGAIAAAMRHPSTPVIGFCGDGGALMTGNELATAIAVGAKPKIVICNNGSYGTIRQHQERDYPRRVAATRLINPDFAQWGRAFGALGLTVASAADIAPAIETMLAHDGPVVVDVRASVEAISAHTTISAMHAR